MTHRRTLEGEGGFTLTEVVMVVVILAILAAIALTTYYFQVQKAERSAVVSTLGNLPLMAETIKIDQEPSAYSDDPAEYERLIPAVDFVPGDQVSDRPERISVHAPDGTWVAFAGRARDTCYYLRLELVGTGRVEHTAPMDTVACSADEFGPTNPGSSGWSG